MSFDFAWQDEHARRSWGTKHDPEVEAFALKYFGGPDPCDRHAIRFLDLGCAVGAQAIWLACQGFTVVGLEGSVAAVQRARRRIPRGLSTAQFIPHDITRPFPPELEPFDAAVDVCSLQCMSANDAWSALRHTLKALKPNGLLLSLTATADCDPSINKVSTMRRSTEAEVRDLYGSHFEICGMGRREHKDGTGQAVSLWVVLCQNAED